MHNPAEQIQGPSVEELSEAGLVRCAHCRSWFERFQAREVPEGDAWLCHGCAAEPVKCRRCSVETPRVEIEPQYGECGDCATARAEWEANTPEWQKLGLRSSSGEL